MKSNIEYDDKYQDDEIYVGKISQYENDFKSRRRHMTLFLSPEKTYLSEKNMDEGAVPMEFNTIEDTVLYCSRGGRLKIHCQLTEYKGEVEHYEVLHLSRKSSNGVYGAQEISLPPEAVFSLKLFLDSLHFENFNNAEKYRIQLNKIDQQKASKIITNEDFKKIIEANVKSIDDLERIVTLRKRQEAIIRLENIILNEKSYKNEVDIQNFLRKNLWMFSNDYVFFAKKNTIDEKNIMDLAPINIESFIDIVEVKLPTEKLFNYDVSHNNYYPTAELTKAIAQVQNYIFRLELQMQNAEYQTNNKCKVIRPNGIILFGTNDELKVEELQYLRILNSSYHNIKIITFQQLLEKAKNTLKMLLEESTNE